ncbi:MAG: beta-ketoacyl-ACP synthase II, partial [Silvanigrellaceae bacterium]|nr:beta-ketoacyl-ACP synthase II [Silvanigrellaceae bacterium]
MICGGAESALSPICFAGFNQMKALATKFLDEPEKASRPWDTQRSGFVMGEGAGILILEEYEYAKTRNAPILCEFVGFGASGDAYHLSSPPPDGEGAARSMKMALETAGLQKEEIGYINAHGTSTDIGDITETKAIKTIFGSHAYKLNISSTKSMTGHLLGGAGGVEAVFSVMALVTGMIPPTINLVAPGPQCDLNYTANEKVSRDLVAVLSNSFGFGGTNCTLAFKKL